MPVWNEIKIVKSTDDNVLKYVFEKENAVAESVLYKYPTYADRTVICCSTQSGCPIGCRFCGAGDNFVRSLTAEEIVSQPVRLIEDTGISASEMKRLQIMFMSMGEPLLNPELEQAIRELHRLYPSAALLVSTSAPRVDYSWIENVSIDIPTVGLQFSVHESTDTARNALVPFKAKLTLSEIADQGERWFSLTGRKPFFNYCAHEKNTSDEDVKRLQSLFHAGIWNCTISVICERDESVAAANERQYALANDFSAKMIKAGYDVRVFNPAGQDDIGGGCGQLWFVQKWMEDHPHLAKPSVGNGLSKIHTPHDPTEGV